MGIFFRKSRAQQYRENNLGVISVSKSLEDSVVRSKKLAELDRYYENKQYDKLLPWETKSTIFNRIGLRDKKPKIVYPFAQTLTSRVASKLVGERVFPSFTIVESPDDQQLFAAVVRESNLQAFLTEPMRKLLALGSMFVRFYLTEGSYKLEWYNPKYCYPTFGDDGDLESVEVKYIYEDPSQKDNQGNYKRLWFKMLLNRTEEVIFDNPEYKENVEPDFEEVDRVEHGMGFVQGEWFKTSVTKEIDGPSLYSEILGFIDEFCYNLSQSSKAVQYNQDPQLTIRGMQKEELEDLIRSSETTWSLGREGEASFLETNLNGVQIAADLRTRVKQDIQEITRVLMLDPEKIVGSAQSAKAMEVLYGPMKDLIDELRPVVGASLKRLTLKLGAATMLSHAKGMAVPFNIPPGYQVKSIDLKVKWPAIFPLTIEDLQKLANVVSVFSSSKVVSRRTLLAYVAEHFNIENIDVELEQINAEPVINPFGGF